MREVKLLASSKQISGFRLIRGGVVINQLAFADDCMLIVKANAKEATISGDCVTKYCEVSGQAVNVQKSSMKVGAKVSKVEKQSLLQAVGMKECKGPFKYLGVAVNRGRVPVEEFKPLVDRMRTKLEGWKMVTPIVCW